MISKKLILKSTLIISAATLLSKVLGLVRQQYSIYLFGGGWEFDSFIAAFRIPNALRELLAEGALSAAFIPIFSAILVRDGKKEAFKFANKVLNISIIITVLISFVSIIVSEFFMQYYHNNPQYPMATPLATNLFNILMFYLPFISLSALIMGMLNSMNRFTIPALGPFFSNVTFLIFLFLLYKTLDIQSLAYATIIGGLTYFVIQIPVLTKEGFRFQLSIDFKDENIKEFITLFIPFAMAMGIPKLNNILSNLFSDDITGANTALSQGFFLIQFPLSVFVAGISMVSLPNMSKYFEINDMNNFKELILMGLRMVFFFTMPSVIGLMILDFEIARFIYHDVLMIFSGGKSGKISDLVIRNIALAQYYYAPGILAMGLSIIFIRAFQSMKDMKTMIYSGLSSVVLHLIIMTILIRYSGWSFEGIALSITISSFFNLVLLIAILLWKIGNLEWKDTIISVIKVIFSSLIMGIFLFYFQNYISGVQWISIHYIDNILNTTLLIFLGMMSYFMSLYILKEKEFRNVLSKVVSRIIK